MKIYWARVKQQTSPSEDQFFTKTQKMVFQKKFSSRPQQTNHLERLSFNQQTMADQMLKSLISLSFNQQTTTDQCMKTQYLHLSINRPQQTNA